MKIKNKQTKLKTSLGLFSPEESPILFTLFLAGIISRLPFLEKMQSHWDGPQYSIGVAKFPFFVDTVGVPGYPLYITLGKTFNLFMKDPHISILLVSVLFSGIGAVVFYLTGKIIFERRVGIIASVIFLSSPTLYFFGITANPYGLLATTATVVALISYEIRANKKRYGIFLGLAFSFAIGIRPQDLLFLLPLAIYGFFGLDKKNKLQSFLSFLLLSLWWFIPLIYFSGGPGKYFGLISPFFHGQAKLNFSLKRIVDIFPTLIKGYFLTLGITSIFPLFYLGYLKKIFENQRAFLTKNKQILIIFFLLWITPSLFFNIFVRSDHAAHQMAYLSAFIFLASFATWKLVNKYSILFKTSLAVLVVFNLYTFFHNRDPYDIKPYVSQSYHYSEIVKNNNRLNSIINFIRTNYPPESSIVETDPEIFRQATYYLYNYDVYSFSSLDTNEPSIIGVEHFGYAWNYKRLDDVSHIFVIQPGISKVIIIPNNKSYKFEVKSVKKFFLKNNAFIYILDTNHEKEYKLSLNKI